MGGVDGDGHRRRAPGDIGVGIVGAVIGGFIMNLLGQSGVGGFNLYSFLVAVLGACVLIAIVRAMRQ